MLFHAARLPARIGADGELALIDDQDRLLWDRELIAAAMTALDRSATGPAMSVWHVQAAIAGAHAVAPSPEQTEWARIVALYDDLVRLQPTPVVKLNRAIAIARVCGADAGLAELRAIAADRAMEGYYLYHAAAAHLLAALGEREAAAERYRAALGCPCSRPEQRFLERKLEGLK
jgi:RNA polymerase sigma-70 factor (ECF subfamily)